MYETEQGKQLLQSIKQVLEYQAKDLVRRPAWGTITFDNAEHDLKRIFNILKYLIILPIEYLTDQATIQIKQQVDSTRPLLEKIDKFTIEQQNALQIRDTLVQQIHQASDNLYTAAASWIPFLAYQKGDVSENINRLSSSVAEANEIANKTKTDCLKKMEEIGNIITKAREASASAGAGVFTSDFRSEAEKLLKKARPWLIATMGLAIATLAIAILTWFWTDAGLDKGQIWLKVSSKLIALSVLMTGTLWCGKMYKALMHQSTVNQHRALSLQTFQAFSAAASDDQTKNAVLLETTRSIFAPTATGFVESNASGPETDKIVEIAKYVLPK